ncbi:hypothetical protein [Novosphingobium mangrovi (ex Huang et al. 2023)]|uniref:Phosphatidate cytidylyltransferase n=1 Tax=Novosphingobium mangrovi (ex Huang et al. 2023) TaxID=2976432 RepID=A0ABT2I196_9SPHN|nr:hypothetical protein [Novosphingobium mangrovi (ex Huang et al. 2023)]MCT2398575.1 hypothetical protein [Novosphingobium mangrovi (ex Huang et al. 2023)]
MSEDLDSPESLEARVGAALERPVEPEVRAFAERLAPVDALGVLFYGSNLRTGSLEGVLDFYVLTQGPQEEKIWPRVSYHEWHHRGTILRAKVATMALDTFRAAAAGELLDTTIWARFVQPSALAWERDPQAGSAIADAVAQAARTAARLAVALGPETGTPEDYWRALFRATYAAEFRVEKAGREDSILSANRAHFDGLLPLALLAQGIDFARGVGSTIRPELPLAERAHLLDWWKRRQRLGKPYNVLRLLKASTTFDGAARYAAWKIERHTGVPIAVTPWRERHPVLAAPGVLWQVWRHRKAGNRAA